VNFEKSLELMVKEVDILALKASYLVPRKKSSTLTDIGRLVCTTRVILNVRTTVGLACVVYSTSVKIFCHNLAF
jgi:hypothetical protein